MNLLNKYTKIIGSLICLGISHSSYADDVELGHINIELYGEVTVSTCGILESEQNKYVDLGSHATKDLSRVGNKTVPVSIPFNLSNCPPGSPVTLTFSGNRNQVNPELLALEDTPNAATNIAIEILDSDKKRLPLDTKSPSLIADQDGNIFTTFYANYIATKDFATPGVANGNAQFTLQYD